MNKQSTLLVDDRLTSLQLIRQMLSIHHDFYIHRHKQTKLELIERVKKHLLPQ